MVETNEDRNEKKMNIGLNLKSNKRNEEVFNINNVFAIFLIKYLFSRLLVTLKNLIIFGCTLKRQ